MSLLAVNTERQNLKNAVASFLKKFALQVLIITMLIQLSLAVSWAWTWMLYWHGLFQPVFLRIATVTGSALAAGVIARVFLHDHLRILRWLSALVSTIVSLACLAYITQAQVGIIFSLTPNRTTDWNGLMQFGLAGLVTWLTLYAWTRGRNLPADEVPDTSQVNDPDPVETAALATVIAESAPVLSAATVQPRQVHHLSIPAWLRWPFHRQNSGREIQSVDRQPSAVTAKPAVRKRRSIRLLGQEEHRCPYCLEIVDLNDPEGVEVCPICHAHHHRACWQVTGNCQVPHIQH